MQESSLRFVENVGNLVCPALFDLGERAKVVILSVTEGEDKPLKYPHMFRAAQLMLLNKVDLLPYLQFDLERCLEAALEINPTLKFYRFLRQQEKECGSGMIGFNCSRKICQKLFRISLGEKFCLEF